MRGMAFTSAAFLCVLGPVRAGEEKVAPKVVLKSPDGKRSVDLAKLVAEGPVLLRLTCACSGCDKELPQFQALQAAYGPKGLRTVAVFREKPDTAEFYATNMKMEFDWVADPKGEAWKVFGATAMPTNLLIDKGGRIVRVVAGCTPDGKNAQSLSGEVARLLKTGEVKVADAAPKK